MEALVPVAVALVLALVAWKALKGLIRIGSIIVVVAFAASLYWRGVI